jgi:N-acyl-D-aspartate/D-glutamate deacylase
MSQLCDACHPTYLLGHWVRERGALSLEEAVRRLTSHPADVFGLHDRGRVAVGLPADLVVFDPERIGAGALQRVYDLPAGQDRLISQASGVEAVFVNGQRLGTQAQPAAGRLLRQRAESSV